MLNIVNCVIHSYLLYSNVHEIFIVMDIYLLQSLIFCFTLFGDIQGFVFPYTSIGKPPPCQAETLQQCFIPQ